MCCLLSGWMQSSTRPYKIRLGSCSYHPWPYVAVTSSSHSYAAVPWTGHVHPLHRSELPGGVSEWTVSGEEPFSQPEQPVVRPVIVVLPRCCPLFPGGMGRPVPHEVTDVPEAVHKP